MKQIHVYKYAKKQKLINELDARSGKNPKMNYKHDSVINMNQLKDSQETTSESTIQQG
jgi:hypothetical protein